MKNTSLALNAPVIDPLRAIDAPEMPYQAAQITRDALMTADFAKTKGIGAAKNRSTAFFGASMGLVFAQSAMATHGAFEGRGAAGRQC